MDDKSIIQTIIGSAIAAFFSIIVWNKKKEVERIDQKLREIEQQFEKVDDRLDAIEKFDAKMEAYLDAHNELRQDFKEVKEIVLGIVAVMRLQNHDDNR